MYQYMLTKWMQYMTVCIFNNSKGFFLQAGSIANGKADKFRGQICLWWMKIIAEIQNKLHGQF